MSELCRNHKCKEHQKGTDGNCVEFGVFADDVCSCFKTKDNNLPPEVEAVLEAARKLSSNVEHTFDCSINVNKLHCDCGLDETLDAIRNYDDKGSK